MYRKIGDNTKQVRNFEYFTQKSAQLQAKKEEALKDPRIQILDEFLTDNDLQFK